MFFISCLVPGGSVLDASQGVEAQSLTNVYLALDVVIDQGSQMDLHCLHADILASQCRYFECLASFEMERLVMPLPLLKSGSSKK